MANSENENIKKILIVDDEETIVGLYAKFLGYKKNYCICKASNGKGAVKILEEESIDLVISDVNMPEMDGFQLLEHMKDKNLKIKIIITTGLLKENEVKAIELGANYVLEKPVNLNIFRYVVEECFKP